jgi:sphinganine-1-phosphate aldolase
MELPRDGMAREDVLARMRERKRADADWRAGRTFSLVYPAGDDVDDVLRDANLLYLYENALNPFRFPSLRTMETEVVAMTTALLGGGDEAGGAMTSGGTESILMAVKSARDRARAEKGVTEPELVAPVSAHPAFAKAAHYLGLRLRQAPLRDDLRADPDAVAGLVNERTALVVGSAPCYPFGVIDPIPELAAIAAERDVWFHTDACLGGFLLPFLERLGERVPPFDFRVPGVTTLSADVHKYGYATKGASCILHRQADTVRRYQLFVWRDWPGGLYGSFAMAGARPAGPIAAAWAVMHYLGESGYLRLARRVLDATRRLQAGITACPELHLIGEPAMSVFAFGSDRVDVMAVGDAMDDRGWHLDRQQDPDALHMMVSPIHDGVVDAFLTDLRESVRTHGESRGRTARYS